MTKGDGTDANHIGAQLNHDRRRRFIGTRYREIVRSRFDEGWEVQLFASG
jgi:hypothetical protein